MGAKKLFPDFDKDREARKNLIEIIQTQARLLYPHEAAWFLGLSHSQTYARVPRAETLNSNVRYSPSVVLQLKEQSEIEHVKRIMPLADNRDAPKPKRTKVKKVPLWRSRK